MEINQGDIFITDLNPIKGHEQAGLRPVLIIQNNVLNSKLNTVVIVPITSNLKTKGFLTTFFLSKEGAKLNTDSIALLFQIRTIDKSRLQKRIGEMGKKDFYRLKKQLSFVF